MLSRLFRYGLIAVCFVALGSAASGSDGRLGNGAEAMRVQPRMVLDFSSPMSACKSYIKAFRSCDLDAVKDCYHCRTADDRAWVSCFVSENVARRKLYRMIQSKFGVKAPGILPKFSYLGVSDESLDLFERSLPTAIFHESESEVTFHFGQYGTYCWTNPAFHEQWFSFAKTTAGWKIPVESHSLTLEPGSGEAQARDEAALWTEAIANLQAGHIETYQQLTQTLKERFAEVETKHQRAQKERAVGK
jgi:hypothetical protein